MGAPEAVKVPALATATAAPAAAEDGDAIGASGLTASEERRRNGQYTAVCIVLVVALMGLYHACREQNAVLAGFLVPALIMLLYLLWVLYSASRARAKQMQLMQVTALANVTSAHAHDAKETRDKHASHGHHHGDALPRVHHTHHHTHHHKPAHQIPKVVVQGPTPVRELGPEKIV